MLLVVARKIYMFAISLFDEVYEFNLNTSYAWVYNIVNHNKQIFRIKQAKLNTRSCLDQKYYRSNIFYTKFSNKRKKRIGKFPRIRLLCSYVYCIYFTPHIEVQKYSWGTKGFKPYLMRIKIKKKTRRKVFYGR